jgi:hypothetical protein
MQIPGLLYRDKKIILFLSQRGNNAKIIPDIEKISSLFFKDTLSRSRLK